MATVDEHGESDRARPAVIDQRVHRCTDRPAGEEDVVHQHDDAVVNRERDVRLAHDRRIADPRQVVAVEGDVDGAERDRDAFVLADRIADARRECVAARADADDGEAGELAVALDDLVRDPGDGASDFVGAEQRGRLGAPFPASQDRSLKVVALPVEYRSLDRAPPGRHDQRGVGNPKAQLESDLLQS